MATGPRLLIIDDEPDASECLRLLVEPRGYRVRTAETAAEARQVLRAWQPEMVLMDLFLPDADGLDLLREFKDASPECQIIMVTGCSSVAKAVEAMRSGALTFIEKPVEPEIVLAMLEKAGGKVGWSASNRRLKKESRGDATFASIVAQSDSMRRLFHVIRMVAPTDASVLILGENGTGKELVASAIHEHSPRKDRPFIKINCAAIPGELMESELFGHKRGSFTGAISDKVGLMEMADGGSLLLDEIAEMPAALQAKLLRVLQEREFRQVGGHRSIRPNFRLICATNVNVDTALAEGRLREDLYFRINTIAITIPPLRERPEDIPLLSEFFLEKFRAKHQRSVDGIDREALSMLVRHHWPGNVRELEHVIERAVIVSAGAQVGVTDLPATVKSTPRLATSSGFAIPPDCTLAEIEKLAILQTLDRTSGNKQKAAHILGMYRPTLYNKLRKYSLSDPNI